MDIPSKLLHEVAITAIVVKDGKYLITRRVPMKRNGQHLVLATSKNGRAKRGRRHITERRGRVTR